MTSPNIDGFANQTADVAGVRLHYWIGGDPAGSPVLLWHGFQGTGYTWRKVAPELAQLGFRVLVPDMRGYGDSEKPAGSGGYDGRALAQEFRALTRAIGFADGRRVILVAHDMGAPAALLWAADHPEEVSGLVYIEEPVLRWEFLRKLIAYTPQAAATGSMWWWLLPLAPNAAERIVVGNERAFLSWFYDRTPSSHDGVGSAIHEYARTFAGVEGVLGAFGVYRAAFTTIEQTEPLASNKVRIPVVAVGGELSRGDHVREMLETVADNVTGVVVPGCGHFVPEERPDVIIEATVRLSGPPA